MTTRERRLAYIILAFIVVAGAAFIGYQFYLQPMNTYARQINDLERDIDDLEDNRLKILKEQKRLEPYAKISLPFTPNTRPEADVNRRTDVARGKYVEKLIEMLQKSGFASIDVKDKKPENKSTPQYKGKAAPPKGKDAAIYTRLEFNVDAKGNLASLTKWMDQFYNLQLLHQIKNLIVTRPINPPPGARPNDLDIKMTIEALVLEGAEPRKSLEPTTKVNLPPVLAPDRNYTSIAAKDLFYGPAPVRIERERQTPFVNTNPHIKLTEIVTKGAFGPEARLFNAFHGQLYTIHPRKAGDGFYVERFKDDTTGVQQSLGTSGSDVKLYDEADDPKEEHSWTVIKLLDEGLVIRGSKKPGREPKAYHLLRPGRYLQEAEPLSKSELKRLGVTEEKSKPEEPVEGPAQAKKEER